MKKTFLSALFLTAVLGMNAQEVTYDMHIELNDGTTTVIPADDVKQVTFVEKTTGQGGEITDLTFDVEFNHISLEEGSIIVTPSDKNATYVYGFRSRADYDQAVSDSGDIMNFDVAWWEFMASYAGGTWVESMQQSLTTGDQVIDQAVEYPFMRWDTEYVFYVYGRDREGNVTSELYTESLFTNPPAQSTNTFTVDVKEIFSNGVNATIATTNDDVYFVTLQKQSYVQWFQDNDAMEDMKFNLLRDFAGQERCFRSGDSEITIEDFNYCSSNTDYYIIIYGYDNGPSTEVTLIPFRTAKLN